MEEGSCAQAGCTRTPLNAKMIIWDPLTSQPQNSRRSRNAKKGGKTPAQLPRFYKLFPTAKIKKKPLANLAKHVNKFYVIAQTHMFSSRRCIFRNLLLQNVLVGLLFSFLARSIHKHPGDFFKKRPFLDLHVQRGLRECHHVSEMLNPPKPHADDCSNKRDCNDKRKPYVQVPVSCARLEITSQSNLYKKALKAQDFSLI